MILLYEAADGIEAHLLKNMLEQSDIFVRIDGEFLQGGVGELQAAGFVRLMVAEHDFPEARRLLDAWDANRLTTTEPDLLTRVDSGKTYTVAPEQSAAKIMLIIVSVILVASYFLFR